MLYVFIDIKFDLQHFVETVKFNFEPSTKLAFVRTIQFVASLQATAVQLKSEGYTEVTIPKSSPLSRGNLGLHFTLLLS
jgi:2-(3-amino-3-carboxypropyl)histidine synthase